MFTLVLELCDGEAQKIT